jgi:tetratricopeptide (TPR) repeat protein
LAKAEANLKKRGRDEPKISDPLVDELQNLRMGFGDLWIRGTQALAAGRVAEAVEAYRKMVEMSPKDPNARMYFGIGLARAGLPDAAAEQFTEALRIAPNHAGVHYNFGLLLTQRGLQQQAIEHFQAAIKSNPELKDGHFQLANLLMRTGRCEEARQEYSVVVRMDPQNGFARLMEAMALARLKDYARARAQLEQGLAALPDDTDIANALARLLAACPEKTVRDGPRALRLAERAFKGQQDLDSGETLAMALAEVGRSDQAAQLQRAMIAQVDQLGQSDLARSLRDNLILYEHGKACRTPWRDDDPIFKPVFAQKGSLD